MLYIYRFVPPFFQISAPLVEAVTTPEVEDAAPAPLPCLDVFAPCETLGDVAPAPVEVVVVEAPAPVVEVPVVVAPTPVAKEPIPRFAGTYASIE